MASPDAEVEGLKAVIARHFAVYGVVVTPMALTFQVTAPGGAVEAPFDALRQELVPRNYIPTIAQERGETVIHVQRRPTMRFARTTVNAALLVITVATTVVFGGAWNWSQYVPGTPWLSLEAVALGTLFFSIPLLTILGAHEMGHYLVARRYKVHASLPFFLPSFPPLGTFGAFISMRDPIPSRRALLDIGASGPLVGFLIAIPVTLAGLGLSGPAPPELTSGVLVDVQPSILFEFLSLFFPLGDNVVMHPLAFAGWVGLFVTAINLLPAGQLDGGHVARALLGDKQHYLSWAAVLTLFALGTLYPGWIIFGFLILMLGIRHPPPLNDVTRLDPVRKLLGLAAVLILVVTFIPQPFPAVSTQAGFTYEAADGTPISVLRANVSAGATEILVFVVNNTGGAREQIGLAIDPKNLDRFGWTIEFSSIRIVRGNASTPAAVEPLTATFVLNATERAVVEIRVDVPGAPIPGGPEVSFTVRGQVVGATIRADLEVALTVA